MAFKDLIGGKSKLIGNFWCTLSITLKVEAETEPELLLGESTLFESGDARTTTNGFRICYIGAGHAHGTNGINKDGREISHTWGWTDYEVSFDHEMGHIKFDDPDSQNGKSFPLSINWNGFWVTLEGFSEGEAVRLKVTRKAD